MKICNKCKEPKDPDDFYGDHRNKDGKQGICKTCSRAAVTMWKKEHPAIVPEVNFPPMLTRAQFKRIYA